jgi:hypothetical protein
LWWTKDSKIYAKKIAPMLFPAVAAFMECGAAEACFNHRPVKFGVKESITALRPMLGRPHKNGAHICYCGKYL